MKTFKCITMGFKWDLW